MKKEELISIVNYRVETSRAAIKESESHLANGYLGTAMNRIYYAKFSDSAANKVISSISGLQLSL